MNFLFSMESNSIHHSTFHSSPAGTPDMGTWNQFPPPSDQFYQSMQQPAGVPPMPLALSSDVPGGHEVQITVSEDVQMTSQGEQNVGLGEQGSGHSGVSTGNGGFGGVEEMAVVAGNAAQPSDQPPVASVPASSHIS